jgi:hypothetical protein
MNETEDVAVWNSIRDFLIRSSRRLAYGQEPWIIYAPDSNDTDPAGESGYFEERFSEEIDEVIRYFVAEKQWPERSKNVVRFYAGQRIEWACNFLRLLLTQSVNGELIFQRPAVSGLEFIEWLLITAYKNRFTRLPRHSGDEDPINTTLCPG